MGRADFIDSSSSGDLCIYSWDAADGCTILRVVVYKGTVNEVTKRNDIHWSGDNWKNVDHKSYSKLIHYFPLQLAKRFALPWFTSGLSQWLCW